MFSLPFLCLLQPYVERAAALSTATVKTPMNAIAWRAGLDPSALSLSPPAAARTPGSQVLATLDAFYLGLGPVMGTRVPTGAVVVSVLLSTTS